MMTVLNETVHRVSLVQICIDKFGCFYLPPMMSGPMTESLVYNYSVEAEVVLGLTRKIAEQLSTYRNKASKVTDTYRGQGIRETSQQNNQSITQMNGRRKIKSKYRRYDDR